MELVVSSLGASAGLFFAVALMLRDRARTAETLFLAAALLLMSLNLVEDALAAAHAYDALPLAFGWSYPALALIGPCLWLHTAAAADPLNTALRHIRWHFAGALAVMLLLVPWAASGALRWSIESGATGVSRAVGVALVSLMAYLGASAVQLGLYLFASRKRSRAIIDARKRRWTRIMLTVACWAWGAYLAALASLTVGYGGVAVSLINSILVLAIYGVAAVAIALPPDALQAVVPPDQLERKYARSALSQTEIERITAKLNAAVEREAIHLDPTLTLQKVAQAIRTSPHDLSQTLNVGAGGFHDWLSKTRIKAALKIMNEAQEEPDVLDIAYGVGFNSKSTFYNAFKRYTGMTPAAWLAQARAVETPMTAPAP